MKSLLAKLAIIASILLASGAAPVARADVTGADGVTIDGYTVARSRRVNRTVYDYMYSANLSNWGTGDASFTATLASTSSNVTVLQGSLDFGSVVEGATQPSLGTFIIRVDRSKPFDTSALLWTVQATPLAPTTFALIDGALAGGVIDAETALLFKVYSEYGDVRLPAQYLGRDDGAREASATPDAMDRYATLSQPTQDLLRPFLLPPDDPASWYQLHFPAVTVNGSASVPVAAPDAPVAGCAPSYDPNGSGLIEGVELTLNGKVCIHYFAAFSGDAATAASLRAAVDSDIWPALTDLLGEPPLDANGLLQIYLLDQQNLTAYYKGDDGTITAGLATTCSTRKVAIYLNRDRKKDLNQTVAHEMTHVFTARYNPTRACGEARWLGEATATWAEHFVYPAVQSEHDKYPAKFLNRPSAPLETTGDLHEYGAYLWFLYMTQGEFAGTGGGSASYVQRVWAALANTESLNAINTGITESGGLKKKWHEFALYNWNRDEKSNKPYRYYWQWDKLNDKAREESATSDGKPVVVKMEDAVAKTYTLRHSLPHLAATYYHFDLTKDNTIRRVRLQNPYYNATHSGSAKLQAIVKTDKGWQPAVDWTGFKQKTLCRDKPDEKFEELVIVISNSAFDDPSFVMNDDQTKLQVSALGCSNWKGKVDSKFDYEGPISTAHATTKTTAATFDFEYELWFDTTDIQSFKVTGGSVHWTSEETYSLGDTCTGSFVGDYPLDHLTLVEDGNLMMGLDDHPTYQIYSAVGPTDEGGSWNRPKLDLECTGGTPISALLTGVDAWFFSGDASATNLPGIYDTSGGIFEGRLMGSAFFYTDTPGEVFEFSWDLGKNGVFPDPP